MDETAIILLQQQYYCTLSVEVSALRRKDWKTQLYFFTVWPPVHTSPSKKKWSFSKTLFKPEVSEDSFAFRSRVDQKHFENGAFRT